MSNDELDDFLHTLEESAMERGRHAARLARSANNMVNGKFMGASRTVGRVLGEATGKWVERIEDRGSLQAQENTIREITREAIEKQIEKQIEAQTTPASIPVTQEGQSFVATENARRTAANDQDYTIQSGNRR